MEETPKTEHVGEVIKIQAGDGQVFYVESCYANMSENIKAGLGMHSVESNTKIFDFKQFRGEVL